MKQVAFISVESDRAGKKEKDVSAIDLQAMESSAVQSVDTYSNTAEEHLSDSQDRPTESPLTVELYEARRNMQNQSPGPSGIVGYRGIIHAEGINNHEPSIIERSSAPQETSTEPPHTEQEAKYESDRNMAQSPTPSSLIATRQTVFQEAINNQQPLITEHSTGPRETPIEAVDTEQEGTYQPDNRYMDQSPTPSSLVRIQQTIFEEAINNQQPSITEHSTESRETPIEAHNTEEDASEPDRYMAQSPTPSSFISAQPVSFYSSNTQHNAAFPGSSINTESYAPASHEEHNLNTNDVGSNSPAPSSLVSSHPTAEHEESRHEAETEVKAWIEYMYDGSVRLLEEYSDYRVYIYIYSSYSAYLNGENPIAHIFYNAEGDVISSSSDLPELPTEELSTSESTQTYVSDDSQSHDSDDSLTTVVYANPQTEEFDAPNSTIFCSGSCACGYDT